MLIEAHQIEIIQNYCRALEARLAAVEANNNTAPGNNEVTPESTQAASSVEGPTSATTSSPSEAGNLSDAPIGSVMRTSPCLPSTLLITNIPQ